MTTFTQDDCQTYLDAPVNGNLQTQFSAPSTVTTAALLFNWVEGIADATVRQHTIDLIKAFIKANGGSLEN